MHKRININFVNFNIFNPLFLIKQKKSNKLLQRYLDTAREIINDTQIRKDNGTIFTKHPIFDYIKIFTTKIQSNIFLELINHKKTDNFDIYPDLLYLEDERNNPLLSEFEITEPYSYPISLKDNAIISSIWNINRFTGAITGIGTNSNNPFKLDELNHESTLILPIGVLHMTNGLHSSSIGILKSEGILYPNAIANLDKAFKKIYFDGTSYRSKTNNRILHIPKHKELGIIFEIGRIIQEENIEFTT